MAALDIGARATPREGSLRRHCLRVCGLALVLGIAFNWPLLAPLWKGGASVPVALGRTGVAVFLTLVWLLALSPSRLVTFVALPAVAVLGAAYVYYSQTIAIVVNEHLFAGIFQTQPGEVREFFNTTTITLLIAVLAAALGVAAAIHRRPRPAALSRWGVALLAMAAYLVIVYKAAPHWAQNSHVFPFNVHRGLAKYLHIRAATQEKLRHKTDLAKAFPPALRSDASDDLIVVVVLGEAARADHLQINGYPRETTPELAKLANVVSFSDVWSCGGITQRSVPCMLTRATPTSLDVSNTETSFISILRATGFDTTWVACDGRAYEWTIPINTIAAEAQHVYFTEEVTEMLRRTKTTPECPGCDGYHLPQVLESIESTAGRGRAFVLMQTHGSHLEHRERYPASFEKFGPVCQESFENVRRCPVEQVINGYDNSVVFTDTMLRRIIAKLEHRNALLFYVADHGQHLGENGYFFHGYLVPDHSWAPLRHVPWVMWASDKFARAHPEQVAAMRANRARPISHDHLFHSVVDCAGIQTPAVDVGLSVCSAQMRERASPGANAEREVEAVAGGGP